MMTAKLLKLRHLITATKQRGLSSSSALHPPWEARVAMVDQALDLLRRLEVHPSHPTVGGNKWVADEEYSASEEYRNVTDAVASLDLRIEENPQGGDLNSLFNSVVEPAARLAQDDNSPTNMAYMPSGGLFDSAIGNFLATSISRYVTVHDAAPAFAAMEHECINWMCRELIGWNNCQQAGGVLTSGGSFAHLIGIHTARQNTIENHQLPRATLYVSESSHYCMEQAGRFLGMQPSHVRHIPVQESSLQMDPEALRTQIQQDIACGLIPIAVCPTAGTTNTGSCDDIQACAEICDEFGEIWLHVDAAYGGGFALTERGRNILGRLDLADTVVLDPHKSLFMPYGLGCLLAKNESKLIHANKVGSNDYLHPEQIDPPKDRFPDIMDLSPELTREFRGLRLWLPLKIHGASTFRAELDEKLDLAVEAATSIDKSDVLELNVVVPPKLSVFSFKLEAPAGIELSNEELDRLNIDFLNEIHAEGKVLLSPYRYPIGDQPGGLCIRMNILSHRTDKAAVEDAVTSIVSTAKVLLRKRFETTSQQETELESTSHAC